MFVLVLAVLLDRILFWCRCDTCKKGTPHISTCKMSSAPQVLVVEVSRFSTASAGPMKLTEHVAFDSVLTLPAGSVTSNQPISYQLCSVIVHEGRASKTGHYMAYVRYLPGNQWFCCDDSTVSVTTWQHVQRQQAYILMYDKDTSGGLSSPTTSVRQVPSTTHALDAAGTIPIEYSTMMYVVGEVWGSGVYDLTQFKGLPFFQSIIQPV